MPKNVILHSNTASQYLTTDTYQRMGLSEGVGMVNKVEISSSEMCRQMKNATLKPVLER